MAQITLEDDDDDEQTDPQRTQPEPTSNARHRFQASQPRAHISDDEDDGYGIANRRHQLNGHDAENDDADEHADEEEDGELSWESPPQMSTASSSSMSYVSLISIIVLIGAIVAGLMYLRFVGESSPLTSEFDVSSAPSTENFYEILGVAQTADTAAITKSFRKLALKLHPDKHPDCADCAAKFDAVSNAYKTLSSPEKRAIYDSVSIAYNVIPSAAIQLDPETYQARVINSPHVTFILLYTDWHKSVVSFSPLWEEVVTEYADVEGIQFARIHTAQQAALARSLPVNIRYVPTIMVVYDGVIHKSKSFMTTRDTLKQLKTFIDEEFPNNLENIPDYTDSINDWLSERSKPVHFALLSYHSRPSLLIRASARTYSDIIAFAHVTVGKDNVKALSTAFAPNSERKGNALFPMALYRINNGSLTSKAPIDKQTLSIIIQTINTQVIAPITTKSYHRDCLDQGDRLCLIYILPQNYTRLIAQVRSRLNGLGSRKGTKQVVVYFIDIDHDFGMTPFVEATRSKGNTAVVVSTAAADAPVQWEIFHLSESTSLTDLLPTNLQQRINALIKGERQVDTADYIVVAQPLAISHSHIQHVTLHIPMFGQVNVSTSSFIVALIILMLILFAPFIQRHWSYLLMLLLASTVILPVVQLALPLLEKYGNTRRERL